MEAVRESVWRQGSAAKRVLTVALIKRMSASSRRTLALCIVAMSFASASGQSFEAFRLRSGMSPKEVQKTVPGYDLRWTDARNVANLVSGEDVYANLGFCGDKLVSVIRNIDADTDFLTYLQDGLRDYGQPNVKVRKDTWTGPGGGDVTWVDFSWVKGGIGRTLSLAPEGRTGSGELRHTRAASLHVFVDRSPCFR